MNRTISRPTFYKEEFTSEAGSYINLGHFKSKTNLGNDAAVYKTTMLTHTASNDSLALVKEPCAQQGLNQTKFHNGFQRRMQKDILNPYSAEEQGMRDRFAEAKAKRAVTQTQSRTQLLVDVDAKTGYNIITGELRGKGPVVRPEGTKMCGNGVGPESIHRGKATLRESGGRFFLPHASGSAADHRQDVLYREGLEQKKYTSILQLGKKDMLSYGIEEQFSKSEYQKTSAATQNGLVESRIPGKYTPSHMPGNPAGRPEIVKQWTSTVDINNRTANCLY